MAPKNPLTPSLRACPEGLPTWSRPEGLDRGLALAGCPRRSAFPKVRFPAAGSPEGSPAPDLDDRSRLAVPPSILSPKGPALRLARLPPEGFRRPATCFLAVAYRVTGYCFAPRRLATKNCAGSSKFRWITKELARECRQFFPQFDAAAAHFRGFGLWIKLSPRNLHRDENSGGARAGQPAGRTHSAHHTPVRFTRSDLQGRARRADGAGSALRVRGRTAFPPRPARRSRRSDTGWDYPRR